MLSIISKAKILAEVVLAKVTARTWAIHKPQKLEPHHAGLIAQALPSGAEVYVQGKHSNRPSIPR